MNEVKFLMDQFRTTFNGDSWHGPSLMKTLKGIDAVQAKERPLDERHSIWELVDNITFWMNAATESVQKKDFPDPYKAKDWPPMRETEEEWRESIRGMEVALNTMAGELVDWSNKDLEE
ncbi:MAG: hypothetical protein NWE89_04140 [Candidatus Bathyarchaeota archaeon]|nr:hypothetical protein [Candidatus Bathyarchaeota archaeon]